MESVKSNATQNFVPIEDVRDGIITLNDGEMVAIIMASSINFSLKSDDERQAILYQFQDFLNSLDFSIQIFVQSRRLDIRPYIALLEDRRKAQTNDLMKIQTEQYINFIKNFTESTSIMTKNFFLVIPYGAAMVKGVSGFTGLFSSSSKAEQTKETESSFEENKGQLEQRVGVVEQGLVRCGIRVARLGNEEVIELFYKIFNPGETEKPIKTS
jgi:type IV secretory pathway VirB4 component